MMLQGGISKNNAEMLYDGCERKNKGSKTLAHQDLPRGVITSFQKWVKCGYFSFTTVCIRKNTGCNAGRWSNFMHTSGQ
jgi:hypothetical protein